MELLGLDPVVSAARRSALAERERVCGIAFPPSVAEWFAVENAERLFHDNTNQDHLVKLAELGDPAEAAQGYLRVAWENQGVVAWYLRLTEGDDPPIYDNNDEWDEDLSQTNWRKCSETFTNFIFDMIATFRFDGWISGMHLEADDRIPTENEIRWLAEWFQQGPTTDAPDSKVFRFFNNRGVIFARSVTADDIAAGRAEWTIEADSPEALLQFVQRLWGVGRLAQTLRAQSCRVESRSAGQCVLEQARAAGVIWRAGDGLCSSHEDTE